MDKPKYYDDLIELDIAKKDLDKYEIVESSDHRYSMTTDGLDEGARTYVYNGWDAKEGLEVKLKMPYYWDCPERRVVDDVDLFKQFLDEAWILQHVKHPNVARLVDYTVANIHDHYVPVVVMENVKGDNLRFMNRDELNSWSVKDQRTFLDGIANGIDAIHNSGLIHGDLGPRAIIVGKDLGDSKVIDFGSAKVSSITRDRGEYWYTGGFTPPSVLSGKDWTVSDEVWSFAVTAHYVLNGGNFPYGYSSDPDLIDSYVETPSNLIKFADYDDYVEKYGKEKAKLLDQLFRKILNKRDKSFDSCIKVAEEIFNILEG